MRAFATIALALALLLVEAAARPLLPLHAPLPAVGALLALYLGLSPRWAIELSTPVAFAIGYLFDIATGAPRGTHALVYSLVSLLAAAFAARVFVRGWLPRALVSGLASLIAALLVVAVRVVVDRSGGISGLRRAPFEAILTALVGIFLLPLFERVDGRLQRVRRRVGMPRPRVTNAEPSP